MTTTRKMSTRRYIKLIVKIVNLSREGYTLNEIDEMLGEGVKSRRWLTGRKTRKFAKMLGY